MTSYDATLQLPAMSLTLNCVVVAVAGVYTVTGQ